MLLSWVPLLLLLTSGSQASHFLGTTMTYTPTATGSDGSVSVVLRYKLNFVSCVDSDAWVCGGNCGTQIQTLALSVVEEISGEWCQREGAITHQLPNNTGFQTVLAGGNWISNIQNNVVTWRAVTDVELRNRSDTGRPNTSPQTTILPALRIPSNCPKTINLLAFDPDGDDVRCRYGNTADSECNPCTPPSVLNLSSSCSLSFNPTNNSELLYAVQLVMEDFPLQTIQLTHTNGSQEVKTTSDAISKIPLQFVSKVGPTVPSCTEGLYLPRFLSPTPNNGAQLNTPAGQALEITIRAEATLSNITGLLYSGPHNVVKSSSGPGYFSLRWTPSASEAGLRHPICFVVQTNVSGTPYHSDLRCVIMMVGNSLPSSTAATTSNTTLTATPTTLSPTPMATTAIFPTPPVDTTITPTTTSTTPSITPLADTSTTPTTTSTTPSTTPLTNTSTTPTTTPITLPVNTKAPGPQYVIALNMKILTTLSLENNSDTIITLIKNKLIEEGLPSTITLRLLSHSRVVVSTASP